MRAWREKHDSPLRIFTDGIRGAVAHPSTLSPAFNRYSAPRAVGPCKTSIRPSARLYPSETPVIPHRIVHTPLHCIPTSRYPNDTPVVSQKHPSDTKVMPQKMQHSRSTPVIPHKHPNEAPQTPQGYPRSTPNDNIGTPVWGPRGALPVTCGAYNQAGAANWCWPYGMGHAGF